MARMRKTIRIEDEEDESRMKATRETSRMKSGGMGFASKNGKLVEFRPGYPGINGPDLF